VRVTIDENGEGFLQIGGGAALPLPTDPNVGWPPSINNELGRYPGSTSYDGVRYPLGGVQVESERIRFQVETNDAFAPFCALQTPVAKPDHPGEYGCFPYDSYSGPVGGCSVFEPGGTWVPTDCGKVMVCFEACACDAQACATVDGLDVPLDAALNDAGDELVGTIVLQDENVGARTIRLERQ